MSSGPASMKARPGCYIDENWEEVPLPIYVLSNETMVTCDVHGDWCPNAYYDPIEIAIMLAKQGFIDCPMCDAEIAGAYV